MTAIEPIKAQLANMRKSVEAPGFRVRTATEHRQQTIREFIKATTGKIIPETPPGKRSEAARVRLLAKISRLERKTANLR